MMNKIQERTSRLVCEQPLTRIFTFVLIQSVSIRARSLPPMIHHPSLPISVVKVSSADLSAHNKKIKLMESTQMTGCEGKHVFVTCGESAFEGYNRGEAVLVF